MLRIVLLLALAYGITALSFKISYFVNARYTFSQETLNYISLFGVTCDYIAFYEILGWKIQAPYDEPWVETINQYICSLFMVLGLVCSLLGYVLQPTY